MEVLLEVQRRLPQAAGEPEHDPLVRVVRGLCGRLEPELADLLQQLCRDGLEAQQMLRGSLEGEVMAVLDVLEPVEYLLIKEDRKSQAYIPKPRQGRAARRNPLLPKATGHP
jgi:hypothetical protein